MSAIKKAIKEKEDQARKLMSEIAPEINKIPDAAIEEVAQYVKGKLEVYERDLKHTKGVNGISQEAP